MTLGWDSSAGEPDSLEGKKKKSPSDLKAEYRKHRLHLFHLRMPFGESHSPPKTHQEGGVVGSRNTLNASYTLCPFVQFFQS